MSKARAKTSAGFEEVSSDDPLMRAFGVDEGQLARLRNEQDGRPFGGRTLRDEPYRQPGKPAELAKIPGTVGEERLWPNRGKASRRLKAQQWELQHRMKDVKSYIIVHDLKTYQASSFLKLIYVYLLARIVMWWRRE